MSLQDFRMGLTSAFNIVIELRSIEILIVLFYCLYAVDLVSSRGMGRACNDAFVI